MLRVRIGCRLVYSSPASMPSVFLVQPTARAGQRLADESFTLTGATLGESYRDGFGNRCQRITLAPGTSSLVYDALAIVPAEADEVRARARQIPPQELPSELLRYTLPSRYAETDELLGFAWETFARDRAHLVVALCRAFNMPARYAVSYLPDIDVADDGNPMDFHAYAEVWLEGGWFVFDPHDLAPRKGRVFVAAGLDAADAAFATLYGGAMLTDVEIWADEVAAHRPEAPVEAYAFAAAEASPV